MIRKFLLPYMAKMAVIMIMKTCRVNFIGLEAYLDACSAGRIILALWHKHLIVMPYFLGSSTPQVQYSCVVSDSRDGRILGDALASLSNVCNIRTPHNAKHRALKEIVDTLRINDSVVVITPDGSRGPSMQAKLGLVFAAEKSGANIIPFTWKSSRFFELKSWDKMRIPKPFSKVTIALGDPIPSGGDIAERSRILQQRLVSLEESLSSHL